MTEPRQDRVPVNSLVSRANKAKLASFARLTESPPETTGQLYLPEFSRSV